MHYGWAIDKAGDNLGRSIILLASRDTVTLSILALEAASPDVGQWERASVVSVILMAMTVSLALIARKFGLQWGVRHR